MATHIHQTAQVAVKVAAFKHAKLSAVRLAGDLTPKSMEGTSLDELLERIKAELTKLGPLIDLEVMCEPEGSRTEGGLAVGSQIREHDRRSRA